MEFKTLKVGKTGLGKGQSAEIVYDADKMTAQLTVTNGGSDLTLYLDYWGIQNLEKLFYCNYMIAPPANMNESTEESGEEKDNVAV